MLAAVLAAPGTASAQDATPTCAGQAATIVADGPGEIEGTDGNDVIVGSDGADVINAGAGRDFICAGDGDDTILGGDGRDIIEGGDGDDEIFGNLGNDVIRGGDGDDVIRAGFDEDIAFGGPGNDDVSGGPGNDLLRGGIGDDRVSGRNGSDIIDGGVGNDEVRGGAGNDQVRGSGGDDDLTGGNGIGDFLNGGDGIDVCRDRGANTTFNNCDPDFALTLLHINDHHSHLAEDGFDLELGGAETSVDVGGFPRVVAKMDELRAENADGNVVSIHAGDAVTGTLFHSLFGGEADAALMNEACFDIFGLGNHEFDDGDAGLAEFLGFLGSSDSCDTEVLAANVVPAAGTPLNPNGEILFSPFTVIDYGDDQVGYVGIDIANKTQNSSSPLETTEFLDEIETAQTVIDQLTADGIDKIVLVTHIQLDNDVDLARAVTGVDVIIGGDSHSLLGDFSDIGLNTEGRYPRRTADAAGSPVCIAHAWQYSSIVGELAVSFDENGVVTGCEGTPHLLLGDNFEREAAEEDADDVPVAGDDLAAVLADIEAAPELSIVTPDADAAAVLAVFAEQVEVLEQEVIGTVEEDLCLERIPGQGRSTICDVADTAANGGDIQQLVAEAFNARSFESDISIQNAGGVRIDVPAGPLTIATAYEILPFSNTIVNLEMSGTEILAALEEGLEFATTPDGSTGAYPYASGLRFDVDLNAAAGERLSNVEFREDGAWGDFDETAMYTVATNSFQASGGDGYDTLAAVSADGRADDTFLNYAQTFIDYVVIDLGGVVAPLDVEDYSTQNFTPLAEG